MTRQRTSEDDNFQVSDPAMPETVVTRIPAREPALPVRPAAFAQQRVVVPAQGTQQAVFNPPPAQPTTPQVMHQSFFVAQPNGGTPRLYKVTQKVGASRACCGK